MNTFTAKLKAEIFKVSLEQITICDYLASSNSILGHFTGFCHVSQVMSDFALFRIYLAKVFLTVDFRHFPSTKVQRDFTTSDEKS